MQILSAFADNVSGSVNLWHHKNQYNMTTAVVEKTLKK